MEKNTKILLGLGLIGLAYYLWQKSSKKESIMPTDRAIPIGQQNKCELLYLKAVANAKKAASMGAMVGIAPKEIFMKQCEVAGNPIQESITNCSGGLVPCPDDSGCFDPSKNPISDWEAGRPHPCSRVLGINIKDTRPIKNG